jgi:F0F1-type ATP synthase membrane subunit c/vacuolar-type H+-ATPase subunit K
MDAAVRIVRMIRLALMASVVLYALIGELLGSSTASPDTALYFAVTFLAIADVGAIVVMRRMFVVPAEATLAKQPEDPAALNRWRAGYIVIYGLSEAVALFGLVLRFLGFSLSHVATFYAVGLILMMFFGPRRPSNELG